MKKISETELSNRIVREASRFVGLREVRPNARWDNPATPGPDAALCLELREKMRPVPWEEGWPYCIAFVEAMVVSSLRQCGATEDQVRRFSRVMNAHVMSSLAGFRKLGLIVQTPSPVSVWFAQHGATTRGHAGIVPAMRGVSMSTIEANTSLDPSNPIKEREGDWITTRVRHVKANGKLVTRGFLPVASILKLIES